MSTNEQLVHDLQQRGITPHDIEDLVLALKTDAITQAMAGADEATQGQLTAQVASETDALTVSGLVAQVDWLAGYYNNPDNLHWALSGYLNLPMAA